MSSYGRDDLREAPAPEFAAALSRACDWLALVVENRPLTSARPRRRRRRHRDPLERPHMVPEVLGRSRSPVGAPSLF